jgi:hypothetical protein
MSEENKWSVVKFVQEMLEDEKEKSAVTPQLISEMIDSVLKIMPKKAEGLDRDSVTEELIRRSSEWVGDESSLVDMTGHEPWLNNERKKDWRYWQRYREWQELKLSLTAVEGLDKSTDSILSMLEDPKREGAWDRRGMVVGHVQSGKTGNYTGLICKAADAGYKIIIVLAGLHNNLRAQTQTRLDEGFLGYETSAIDGQGKTLIGVGKIDPSPTLRPQYVTNRTETGDFNTRFVRNLGVSPEQRPWLFVVKKNKTVLTRLLKWIQGHVAETKDPLTGRPLVTHLPLLIIDDEADHASVDTGEKVVDESGNPDLKHEPTAINSLIRQILHSFSRKAYVGYTATPFANIYIHEHGETEKEGPDLFPSAFITNLSAPSSYIGPSKVFGLSSESGRTGALNLVRVVEDQCSQDGKSGWMPISHKSSHVPLLDYEDKLPASLIEAIQSFILSCAVRVLRGQGAQHTSMLVHVTRFNLVQQHVHRQVQSYVHGLRQRFRRRTDFQTALTQLKSLWENDFVSTSRDIEVQLQEKFDTSHSWMEIEAVLLDVLEEIDIRMINGKATDALDYADSASGLKVIAIGGDKLARGLTLEGLCTSYFLRASKMYDTLMQMGRWFGYRPGYLDLCRLYTTSDLVEWFEHIADAADELRAEFDFMMDSRLTPREYGLKVRSHPVLMVTSPLKMRTAKTLYLSFSGDVVETVSFFKHKEVLQRNISAFEALINNLGIPSSIPPQQRNGKADSWSGVQWTNVTAQSVTKFLRSYETHPDSRKVKSDLLADFIEEMSLSGELTSWTVAVVGGGIDKTFDVGGNPVRLMKRQNKSTESEDKFSIGRLLSPHDEAMDLNEQAWSAALELTKRTWVKDPGRSRRKEPPEIPNGPAIRHVKGLGAEGVSPSPEKGLLIISLLDPEMSGVGGDLTTPVLAFAISFPSSNAGKSVPYLVTNVLWEQQYGASE